MRRSLAGGFSERFIRDDAEPTMRQYGEKLVETLRDECAHPGRRIDLTRFYNFTTFDIMGHVVYSEDLGMLASREYLEEIFVPFKYLRTMPFLQMLQYYPWVNALWKRLQPPQVVRMRQWSFQYGIDRVARRHAKGDRLNDIWNHVMTADADRAMSLGEQHSNTELFLVAASETTGTVLSGATYFMAKNPDIQARLAAEIRAAFASSVDISFQGLVALPYLDAFMQECLRMYPPVPAGVPRYVSEENTPCTLLGRAVPLGARIMVSHVATYRYPANFESPDEFAPQRWLPLGGGGEARFANDRLGAVQAFSVGPRNCIGQNMARHEFRLLLAKMVYNFDIRLAPESENWIQQLSWGVWDKGELIVELSPVAR
jgi:cytochrome P450